MRSATQQIRNLEFVAAAQALGCSTKRIVLTEIMPNIVNHLIALLVLLLIVDHTVAQDRTDEFKEGPNLIKNSGLEDVVNALPEHWETNTWSGEPIFEVEEDFAHTGNRCLKISSSDGADASFEFSE